ncbi:hypothetical protein KUTeg_005679 [Tegillarca granosa]|uniref:Uncharacterized protein n=1 Tax=Tegillarca granosa TaxID=220873 RepID=A0ABQ9FHE0_TEGGR|nr:hypothetical protein KUTeg_005679 [Tegillarca granosa]
MSSQQSCCSIASHASSIPCDLIENQDEWFSREIDSVDKIYFGNIEEHEVEEEQGNTDESDPDESHRDSVDIQSTASENESACDRDFNVYRDEDRTEINKQNKFFAETCGCYRLHSKPCSTLISRETILEFRDYYCELDRDELDLVLKTELFSHRNKKSLKRSRDQYKSRERIHQEYYFNGHQVCRATFLFVHGIGKKRLEAVTKSLDTVGLQPRIHRNKGKAPKHALTLQQVQQVRQFLRQYAFQYGVSLPGRLPYHSNLKVTLLPSDRTKADIHSEYIKAAKESSNRIISLSEFKKVWLEQCPVIVVMKPSTDLCSSCQNYNVNLTKSENLDEEQKSELVARYQRHLEKAKLQRDYFRDQCSETKENFSNMPEEYKCRGQQPLSYQGTMHYSFDYAQQVHYRHYAQQVGPLFFKTPRKCQCFGICSEGSGTQIFYLIDESEEVGKGANSVVSMLHHHFHYKRYGETAAKLNMDNCAGQNKNNIVWTMENTKQPTQRNRI